MPYGETLLDLSHTPYETPYQFTDYEKDQETGLHYAEARYYDPNLSLWLSVDSLAEKYPNISSYAYCANNPVKFVDPDGREPRIYVETQGFGHAFVTVGIGDETIVYTYGRYGELGKNKSSARSTTPTGEGVLIRLTGNDAKNFIQEQMLSNEAVAFEFINGSDKLVTNHFEEIFNNSDKIPTVGKYAGDERARLVDTYNLFTNNCVTTSVEGVQSGVKQDLKLDDLIKPSTLKNMLNVLAGEKNSGVVKIPYENIKKELKLTGVTGTW